jgi:hypothetical protein
VEEDMSVQDPRINELLALAVEQGQPLAIAPETICAIEDAGWVIDPFTGQLSREYPLYVPVGQSLGFLATALCAVIGRDHATNPF